MKFLTGLAIAQFVLIGLLFARVVAIESTLEAAPQSTPGASTSTRTATTTRIRPRDEGQALTLTSLDEAQMRAIIREELAAARLSVAAETQGVAAPLDPQQEIEFDYRLEEVTRNIDFYAQTGQINRQEMERLQAQIARLRPADREAMFNRLVRELNSGAIDGRL
jgi:hypothetical protein